uniref:Uncharacterized protein n=1 Tax=Strigamia maritima TaxID=126957 RepID=T1JHK2_STRMM
MRWQECLSHISEVSWLPKIVSCQYAVGVVIPYLLALFVAEKMSAEAENVIIDELAVFSAQSDFLLTSILFLTQTIARNIFAIIQNDKQKDVFKDTSSLSKMTIDVITDSTVDSFLAESEISDLHHDTSAASKDSESEQSMYLSNNDDVSRTDSPISEASRSHHILMKMFLNELNTYETGYNYKGFLFPINYLEGVQHDFERLVGWMKFDTANDYNKLLSRYAALSTQVDEIISLLEEGIQLGMTNHYVSMEGVVQQFDKLQIPAADSGIFAPFINFPDEIEDNTKKLLYDAGKQAYDNRVLPAFRKLRNFIAD